MDKLLSYLPEFLLWGSALYFWGATALFIFILFISEIKEDGWSGLVAFIAFIGLTHFCSNFDVFSIITLKLILLYLGIGLVHSLVRTYLYGRKRGIEKKGKEFKDTFLSREEDFDNDTTDKLKGNVFRWWFLFPISFLTWVFSDLIKDVYNFIYSQFKIIFVKIVKAGQNSTYKTKEDESN